MTVFDNFFGRRSSVHRNQLNQSCSELAGMAEGMLADGQLNDSEISYLNKWLERHGPISCEWPGDVLHQRVRDVVADGIITPDERAYLIRTLNMLIGGELERLAETPRINELALDPVERIIVPNHIFCLTGGFVFAPRQVCEEKISALGGKISASVTKKINYLVVGGFGSDEWKHGSYGTKITKAMEYKRLGCPLLIVHENVWTSSI